MKYIKLNELFSLVKFINITVKLINYLILNTKLIEYIKLYELYCYLNTKFFS